LISKEVPSVKKVQGLPDKDQIRSQHVENRVGSSFAGGGGPGQQLPAQRSSSIRPSSASKTA